MKKYFEKYGKPKFAFEMIKEELKVAEKALKKEKMPSADISTIKSASDGDFITMYEEHIKGTFPNELAEAVIKITDLADSYNFNLPDYIEVVNRYCVLKNPQSTSSRVVVRYL